MPTSPPIPPLRIFDATALRAYLHLLPPVESLTHWTPYGPKTDEGTLALHITEFFQAIDVPLGVGHITNYHHTRWVHHRHSRPTVEQAKITAKEIEEIYRQLRKRQMHPLLVGILHRIGQHPSHLPLPTNPETPDVSERTPSAPPAPH